MRDPFWLSFPIGSLFGIRMRVHWVFPAAFIGIFIRAIQSEIPTAWIDGLWLLSLFFLAVVIHELGHGFAAQSVQGEMNETQLWPLGGMARADYLPHTPWAHLVFALGGPAANLSMCVLAGLGLALFGDVAFQPTWNPLAIPYRNKDAIIALTSWAGDSYVTTAPALMFCAWVFYVNWICLLVNLLLPGLPFDAGQVLRASLWPRLGFRQATFYAISAGLMVAILIFIVSIPLWEPLLVILAYYCYVCCKIEWISSEGGGEESLFGYDFSQGYTSLEKDQPPPPRKREPNVIQRWLERRKARKLQEEMERMEAEERRMDELLDKIQRLGKDTLTEEETRFLKRVSDRYRNKKL